MSSNTYGCADRTYWCWKFTDFPGSRFQEILYTLTWLYNYDSKHNSYYKNKVLLEYIDAGFNYWVKIQNNNGSFNEAYQMKIHWQQLLYIVLCNGNLFYY